MNPKALENSKAWGRGRVKVSPEWTKTKYITAGNKMYLGDILPLNVPHVSRQIFVHGFWNSCKNFVNCLTTENLSLRYQNSIILMQSSKVQKVRLGLKQCTKILLHKSCVRKKWTKLCAPGGSMHSCILTSPCCTQPFKSKSQLGYGSVLAYDTFDIQENL